MTLTAFLLDRIAEQEQRLLDMRRSTAIPNSMLVNRTIAVALADCHAQRGIIEIHELTEIRREPDRGEVRGYWWNSYCRNCTIDGEYEDITQEPSVKPCHTLHAIAAVYADHPAFRDEWRP